TEAYDRAAEVVKVKDPIRAAKYYVESAKLWIKHPNLFEAAKAYESAGRLFEKTNPKRTVKYFKRAMKFFGAEANGLQRLINRTPGKQTREVRLLKAWAGRRDECRAEAKRVGVEIKKLGPKTKLTR
ncbi:hypothetical protein KAW38_02145, partial [Candidatus Micrarchaeota archaeon]|nr:hypothetical protein [Candidatus Micrarchaeota archaeon]